MLKQLVRWSLMALLLAACGGAALTTSTPPPSATPAAAQGKLVVGTAITKPFEFHQVEGGALVGFDVDVAQYIADRLGVQVEWVEMPFAALIPSLEARKVDMTIAAMYITPEREALVDFASPYIDTGLVMVAPADTAQRLRAVEDLAGLKVGVKIGATGARLAHDLQAQGVALEMREYKETLDSLLDLEVGRVDVVLNDYLNTLAYLKDARSALQIAATETGAVNFLSRASLGIAVAKGDAELLAAINAALDAMRAEGGLDRLRQKWLDPATGP